MSIRNTVKQALKGMPGGRTWHIDELIVPSLNPGEFEMSTEQKRRALRDLPYVKRVDGRYIVKGRRVPAQQ